MIVSAVLVAEAQCGFDPERIWMVGDRIDNDIVPAKACGWKTVRIRQGDHAGYRGLNAEEKPDFELSNIGEISRIIDSKKLRLSNLSSRYYNRRMIRKPTMDDISRLAEIHVYGWRMAYRGIVPETYLYKDRQVAIGMKSHASIIETTPENIDLFDDGIVRGFALHNLSRDADKPAAYELYAIYVEPAFQGRGVGTALIQHVEARARLLGKPELILWALEQNEPAHRFYEKHGFHPDGATKTIDEWQARELRFVKQF